MIEREDKPRAVTQRHLAVIFRGELAVEHFFIFVEYLAIIIAQNNNQGVHRQRASSSLNSFYSIEESEPHSSIFADHFYK